MKIGYALKRINTIMLLLLFALCAKGENLNYVISGIVNGANHYQYAYLYHSDAKKLLKTRIENQQFSFVGEVTLEKKGFNGVFLFLSNDSLARFIDQREVVVEKIDREYRLIILEGTPISITVDTNVKDAIVEGGKLNNDYNELRKASRELKYKEFIESHLSSPISLLLIRGLLPMKRLPLLGQLDFHALYNKLSDKVKQSEYGVETLKRIKEQQ